MPPPIRSLLSCGIYIDLDQRAFARSWLNAPILSTDAGLITGPLGIDLLRLDIAGAEWKVLAEAPLSQRSFSLMRRMPINSRPSRSRAGC
jgi:hypothetical protein